MSRRTRVLLVNPWIHDFAAYDYWMRPLGLLYLAGVLSEAGLQVDFVDCVDRFAPELAGVHTQDFPKSKEDGRGRLLRTEIPKPEALRNVPRRFSRYGMTPDMFRSRLAKTELPALILVTSMMTYWYTGVAETISVLQDAFPGVPILLGGIYATLLTKHAETYSGASHVCSGESENTIVALISRISGCSITPRHYNSLDDYPLPLYSLLSNTESLPLLTSRGCPFRCRYCASFRVMQRYRTRDPLRVADEIDKHRSEFGARDFAFYDDALLLGKETHFHVIMREVIQRGIEVAFHMPNAIHGAEVDEKTAVLMREGGCETIRIGLETSHAERQRSSGGKISSRDYSSAMNNLEKAGYARMDIETYIMMGLPGQTAGEVEESIRFVNGEGGTVRLVSYTPIPGTDYWPQALRLEPALEHEPLLQNNSIFPLRGHFMQSGDFARLKNLARELNSRLGVRISPGRSE